MHDDARDKVVPDSTDESGQEMICCPNCNEQFTIEEGRDRMASKESHEEEPQPIPSVEETRNSIASRNRYAPPGRSLSGPDLDETARLAQAARARMRSRRV